MPLACRHRRFAHITRHTGPCTSRCNLCRVLLRLLYLKKFSRKDRPARRSITYTCRTTLKKVETTFPYHLGDEKHPPNLLHAVDHLKLPIGYDRGRINKTYGTQYSPGRGYANGTIYNILPGNMPTSFDLFPRPKNRSGTCSTLVYAKFLPPTPFEEFQKADIPLIGYPSPLKNWSTQMKRYNFRK